jgi:hypothetical protein
VGDRCRHHSLIVIVLLIRVILLRVVLVIIVILVICVLIHALRVHGYERRRLPLEHCRSLPAEATAASIDAKGQ